MNWYDAGFTLGDLSPLGWVVFGFFLASALSLIGVCLVGIFITHRLNS